jgi:enoyl-CoA hydratase/carnithine racemase
MVHVILEWASDNARMGFTRYSLELFPVMEAHNACHNPGKGRAMEMIMIRRNGNADEVLPNRLSKSVSCPKQNYLTLHCNSKSNENLQ